MKTEEKQNKIQSNVNDAKVAQLYNNSNNNTNAAATKAFTQ